jgi:23S rRNA (guanosine2251-2'-O)-methyltransferase
LKRRSLRPDEEVDLVLQFGDIIVMGGKTAVYGIKPSNLNRTLEMLKEKGVWLYAADMEGEDYRTVNFSGPMALIVGAEGEGVSRLVLENSDNKVSLPMKGGVGSLNASVAAGILLYAAMTGRG